MRQRLSLILSSTAVIVAVLGSTPIGEAAWNQIGRNSVGTPQLKRNAVTAQKVAPNAIRAAHVLDGSLLTADFKAGQIPQGPKGDKGEKGEKGAPGAPGAPGISGLQRVTVTSGAANSDSPKQVFAQCPAGKKVFGGGAFVNVVGDPPIALRRSNPTGEGWVAHAFETAATGAVWSLSVSLICGNAMP